MNNARRKQIAALADRLSALAGELEELKSSCLLYTSDAADE